MPLCSCISNLLLWLSYKIVRDMTHHSPQQTLNVELWMCAMSHILYMRMHIMATIDMPTCNGVCVCVCVVLRPKKGVGFVFLFSAICG